MVSEQELREGAMKIVKSYVEKLEEKSKTLGLKEFSATYSKIGDSLIDDLNNFFDEEKEDSYLRGSVAEEVMNHFRDEYRRIREQKKTQSE